jgi:hypothetical protein
MMILKTSRANLSSNDQLSLDLPFAATKSLTARVGPTPTFTRGSGATYIGSDGLIHGIDTSTTSNSISAASKTFTLAATLGQDQFWRAGDAVEASNGANIMAGTVTSYDAVTQSLVCNMTTVSGTGTFTSWRIGYRGPRFDHDPVTLACKGLLIEEGRTNLLTRSAEFENSAWGRAAVGVAAATITPNSDIAPDGTTTADTANFSATTATNQQGMLFRTDLTATIGQVVTFSVYMRVPSGTATVYIELAEGSPVSGQSVACNVTTTWQRFSITRTAVAATQIYTQIGPDTRSFAGQPAVQPAASVFLWGAQLEAGSFPTSYIPTTTGTLARSADVCNITGGNFNNFYNQSEGTLFANSRSFAPQPLALPSRRVVTASDGTSGNRVAIGNIAEGFVDAGLSQVFIVATGGSVQATLGISGLTLSSINKTVGAYKQNDFAVSTNGSAVVTDATGLVATSLNRLDIGNQFSGDFLCGHIAAIRYYKKRLPNAKLQALTA